MKIMLTDMAPSAPGQFYSSHSQMGITNIAPHIQKSVSIISLYIFHWNCVVIIINNGRLRIVLSTVRVIKIRINKERDQERHNKRNISKIWCTYVPT
jgi:hypothetical protein